MKARLVEVPEDLLTLLRQSRIGGRPESELVRLALAIHHSETGQCRLARQPNWLVNQEPASNCSWERWGFHRSDTIGMTTSKSGMQSVGILRAAREDGLIATVLPFVLELRVRGQWISERLVRQIAQEESANQSATKE